MQLLGEQAVYAHLSAPALDRKQKPVEAPLLVHPCAAIDERLVDAVRAHGQGEGRGKVG